MKVQLSNWPLLSKAVVHYPIQQEWSVHVVLEELLDGPAAKHWYPGGGAVHHAVGPAVDVAIVNQPSMVKDRTTAH